MGLFDIEGGFKMLENSMMEEFASAMEEYQENQKYPSITTLPFIPVPLTKAEELRKTKKGFFGWGLFGGDKEAFIASIEEGRTTYAEVLVLARKYRIVKWADDPVNNTYEYYYRVADLKGNVMREDVPVIDDQYAVRLAYNSGNSSSDTGCAEVVDPRGYPHMFIVHYYLKDDQYYVLLTKEQFDDMKVLMDHAGYYYLHLEDRVGYRW